MEIKPMVVLLALSIEQLTSEAKLAASLGKNAKDADKANKVSFPAQGKVVQAVAEHLEKSKNLGAIARTLSLADYWKNLTGEKMNNHALSCSVAFDTYVKGKLIDEPDYDKNTAQCLELAASISTACGGDMLHEAVAKAAAQLKDRSKDSAKHLKEILATVKDRKPLTTEQVENFLRRAYADGFHIKVAATLRAELTYTKDEVLAQTLHFMLLEGSEAIAQNVTEDGHRRFSDDTIEGWYSQRNSAQTPPPVKIITAPAGQAETETKGAEAEQPAETVQQAA